LFRFSSISDEEGFGLFDDNQSSSLAMAVEAHESFMHVDISGFLGSQIDAREDEIVVRSGCICHGYADWRQLIC
jgi:hypothetical protein